MHNTGRQNLTNLQTLRPNYTFPKAFGALYLNPTSELLHHLSLLRYSNLKVQKAPFFAILRVKLHRELIFILKSRTTFTLQNPF